MELIIKQLVSELKLKETQVESIIKLIDEGNTIPFIARYRKEMTGGVSDEVLRAFDERLKYLKNLSERKTEVIRLIDEQGKLTEDLRSKITKAKVLQKVEDLYRPFKQKKRTRATIAKEKGLEDLANIIIAQESSDKLEDLAAKFINAELKVETADDAIAGAMDIMAENISDNASFREKIRDLYVLKGVLETTAVKKEIESVYEMYYEYSEAIKNIANHRVLAINRAENEKFIKVKMRTPDDEILTYMQENVINENSPFEEVLKLTVADSYKRLISPSVEREVRNMIKETSEVEAIKVFAKNTQPLLMIAPVKDAKVLAVDPSFRTGCKLSVLDETGKLLAYKTIYPNAPQNKVEESRKTVVEIINKYDVDIVSIGNGTASRETETFIAESLKEIEKTVYYTIVSEAGASVYSASKLANDEYPDIDVSIRGAISIGRRLQDPLAELVKIDPKSIGVGQYQHDLNQKKLDETLKAVVEDCVNKVGVDLNTATPALLKYVSGVSDSIAKNIVEYRDENGKFTSRNEIKKVKRLGGKAFEQCAGFLRISDGKNPLDNTSVHPESYEIATGLLEKLGYDFADISKNMLSDIDTRIASLIPDEKKELNVRGGFEALKALKVQNEKPNKDVFNNKLKKGVKQLSLELNTGELTLKDIIEELKKPGRDPREDMPKPVFRSDVLSIDDLSDGMIMTGTVRNVVDFGAFVDIGVKTDGLVHISELSDKFVKNPMDVVSVGDNVTVKIIKIDRERIKISLTMKNIK